MCQKAWLSLSLFTACVLLLTSCSLFKAPPSLFDQSLDAYYHGDLDQAIHLMETWQAQDPQNILALENLAELYKEKADYQGACRYYEKISQIKAPTTFTLCCWAQACYCAGEPARASLLYSDALGSDPDNAEALWGRGLCQVELKDWDGARDDFNHLVEVWPNNAQGHLELARVYETLKQYDFAEKEYSEALRIDRSLSGIHLTLASLYEAEQRPRQALMRYKKAQIIFPGDSEINEKLAALAEKYPFLAEEEAKSTSVANKERQATASPLVTPVVAPEAPLIRVGIVPETRKARFKASCVFKVREKESQSVLGRGETNKEYTVDIESDRVRFRDEGGRLLAWLDNNTEVVLDDPRGTFTIYNISYGKGYFFGGEEDRIYRGTLEIIPRTGFFRIINIVNVEEYLYGVVAEEMPLKYPAEALAAQAIAARSETLSKRGVHGTEGFDLCADVHCAVYRGVKAEDPAAVQAVNDTAGLVLFSGDLSGPGGRLVDAVYMSSCGGHTESGVEVWGSSSPGLVGVRDCEGECDYGDDEYPLTPARLDGFIRKEPQSFCGHAKLSYRWKKVLNLTDIQRLEKQYKLGSLQKVAVGKRTPAGYVKSITLFGTSGNREWQGDRIRGLFGSLKSNLFKVEQKTDSTGRLVWLAIYGAGFGHGVGMCQEGAGGMARLGYSVSAILKHYYPGTVLGKYYASSTVTARGF